MSYKTSGGIDQSDGCEGSCDMMSGDAKRDTSARDAFRAVTMETVYVEFACLSG